jgi:rhodanese-related sulfurtransferase
MDDPRSLYASRETWQIVDVREPYEWRAGHIEGAIHIPLAEVMAGKERGRIDPSKPVMVVCKTGNRSELATLMLQARGLEAQNLEGGTERWVAAGLPIVSEDGSPGRVA